MLAAALALFERDSLSNFLRALHILAGITWIGLLAPANTPPAIVNRLNAEIERLSQLKEVREQMEHAILSCQTGRPQAADFPLP